MNLAYYVLVFDRGTDAWLELAGMGRAYRATGGSVFAVESHIIYQREALGGADLRVATALAGTERNRIHLMHEMQSAGELLARQETLLLHVDLTTRRAAAMPGDVARRVQALAPPSGVGLPAWVGRHVAIGQRPPAL